MKLCLYNSQVVSTNELSKTHHKVLDSVIEFDGLLVPFESIDSLSEFIFGKGRHELCEYNFSLVHGLCSGSDVVEQTYEF